MAKAAPQDPLILRMVHLDNLPILLGREGLDAPNSAPASDSARYRSIHDADILRKRANTAIPCGPGGTILDYVPFYFGERSPMLYRLWQGGVAGYSEGQQPLVYLVSKVSAIAKAGLRFVFSDGQGIAKQTSWYDDVSNLDKVDWASVHAADWRDSEDDPDRKRRKQAEFLVHGFCPWAAIIGVAVINERAKGLVGRVLGQYGPPLGKPVKVWPNWYY